MFVCVCLLCFVCSVNVFVCVVCELMCDAVWFHVRGVVVFYICYC